MPPKVKITKDMIIEDAFRIVREEGAENLNVRSIAKRLGCSTQPVLYAFASVEEVKKAVYRKADEFHSAYLMNLQGDNPFKEIGFQYIRFGAKEKNLFRFLFQTNEFAGHSIIDLINGPEMTPVLEILAQGVQITLQEAGIVLKTLFLFAHGYASMYANNDIPYDEAVISADLDRIFAGAVCTLKEEAR